MANRRNPQRARRRDRDTEAYNAGRRDHKLGRTLDANPYGDGTLAAREWSRGWRKSARGRDTDQADPGQ